MGKKVLIAIDNSDEANEVIRAAIEIVGNDDAALSLISVITPISYVYGAEYGVFTASSVNIEQEACASAEKHQAALEKEFNLQCEKTVVIGQPAYEIRKLAAASDADLIVIGSHARHGLGLILGSTANGVLHGAPCDVFVVRIKDTAA